MKKIFLTLMIAVGFTSMVSAQATGGTSSASASAIKFAVEKHDFGTIPQNIPVTYNFDFTNTGKVPLIITGAQGSCGCTVPDYTREAIAPGGKGTVKVTYNAAAIGTINKTVTVNTNSATTPVIVLSIGGEVKAAPAPGTTAAASPAPATSGTAPKKN